MLGTSILKELTTKTVQTIKIVIIDTMHVSLDFKGNINMAGISE